MVDDPILSVDRGSSHMTRLQFLVLAITSSVTGLLLLGQIALSQMERSARHERNGMEILIQEGEQSNKLWQQVALLTYQVSQQDPMLKEVLRREQITVSPTTPNTAPSPAPAH
jgi:hypothetical protein